MPLYTLSGPDAVATRKSNPKATWGNRNNVNRVEPMTAPGFDVPMILEDNEAIFTVGSCFARHVENALIKRGFEIPMRSLFREKEFFGLDSGVVNNFGAPSIFNEFAWAMGEQEFAIDDHIIEVQTEKFVDLHVIPSVKPTDFETVLRRRKAITAAYKSFTTCRLIVVTLGLVEVWFDTNTEYYLNSTPRPSMLRKEPERFEVHVLSFDEVQEYLSKALKLMQKYGHSDLRVLLTVSPVPLATTHRDVDVLVANMYSKSVLRSVAEHACSAFDFVSYYPSYESVTLSDRALSWSDDFIHVTDEIVAFNINRMVDAYAPSEISIDEQICKIEDHKETLTIQILEDVLAGPIAGAERFIDHFTDLIGSSSELTLLAAKFYQSHSNHDRTIAVLDKNTSNETRITLVRAKALLGLSRTKDALGLVHDLKSSGMKTNDLWQIYFDTAKALNDPQEVLSALDWWTQKAPRRAGRSNAMVGKWFSEQGMHDRAIAFFIVASSLDSEDQLVRIYHVDTLLKMSRFEEAGKLFQNIAPTKANEAILHGRLKDRLGDYATA